ncbi:hypothetical protein Afil01_63910 [Actinorhabdospora filicis]|uniref:NAD-dependent epimerase/dehydratase domain-containing protein n=1 Tax=Actinorhabdospora filicis TaxID=1785913 RepID=A0A9W6SRH4_9ACTN|nr:NAD-dependent epimerase/dehydratase family protein [Actinorhabdospora filicis]GLZ81584.1 hypothetical protein Afil01_63910 [Actinorhabdospora filicis]
MKVLVIGATGYIGAAVSGALAARGHAVTGLSRSGRAAHPGVEGVRGDITDPAGLVGVASRSDVIVHAAAPTGDEDADASALEALLGADRPLVYTSGIWVLGETGRDHADEDAPLNPLPIAAFRPRMEKLTLGGGGSIIRPGIVYGDGAGIPAMLVDWAAAHGIGRHVGGPGGRWPMVHVEDLAGLFALVVERFEAGAIWHGIDEPAVSTVALAAAADLAAGGRGRTEPLPLDRAVELLGAPYATALALDQDVRSTRAARLGWSPARSSVDEIATGSYVRHV